MSTLGRTDISFPILLVDDEPQILKSFSVMLRTAGLKDVVTIDDSRQVMGLLAQREVALVVLDLSMPHISGVDLLSQITQSYPQVPVIIVSARNELETAVDCMRMGAFDYLLKPVETGRFEAGVKRAFEMRMLRTEISSLKKRLLMDELEHQEAFSPIIAVSKKMRAIFQYVEVVAGSQQPVLITGETGVGKELVAKSVHDISGRKGPFIAVNVAGLDDTMFSDTLFGHKKGAYTGADDSREGLIAEAHGGTIFLDEIGDTSEPSQIKLLRLLQEHKYYPLGSDVPKQSGVRIVVATNHDLQKLIADGRFRKDLYYRLFTHHIHIPALRERQEDIALILNHYLEEAAMSMNKKKPTPPAELITLLKTYHFPGNVRELQAMAYDAVARHKSGVLSMESFKNIIGQERSYVKAAYSSADGSLFESLSTDNFPNLKTAEDALIARALYLATGNQGIAAALLGITRQALNKRLSRHKPVE